jgi:hypothetical protein
MLPRGLRRHRLALLAFLAGLGFSLAPGAAPARPAEPTSRPSLLDAGYGDMYDLRFDAAHKAFEEWQQQHPEDPFGYTSDAAAYLFSEFDRLGVLQSKFFLNDGNFTGHERLTPDPGAKQAFDGELARSQQLADSRLGRAPDDSDALFAKVLDLGLRADYLALIEKKNVASLRYIKTGGGLAEKLLRLDPSRYDAYLAVGIENYLLSLNPAPVRWILRMYGMGTDKSYGIEELRLTAEKGHYLLPYARLLLAVAALRDGKRSEAAALLRGLAKEFPDNPLFAVELARLHSSAIDPPPVSGR